MTETERSGRRVITGIGVIALVPSLTRLVDQLASDERPLDRGAAVMLAVYFGLTVGMWGRSRAARWLTVAALALGAAMALLSIFVERGVPATARGRVIVAALFAVMASVLARSRQVDAYFGDPGDARLSAPSETGR
jgi:hypothetical protein